MKIFYFLTFIVLLLILLFQDGINRADSLLINTDTLKAQIDITVISGGIERYAKRFDKVKAGEKFRIHIKAEHNYFLWIIYSNSEQTFTLADTVLKINSFNTFPADDKYFEFDGKDAIENIFIFLSIKDEPRNKIKYLKNQDLLKYIHQLSEQSKCNVSEQGEPLINISGNLREISTAEKRFSIYQGINYLIKEFKFNVKK